MPRAKRTPRPAQTYIPPGQYVIRAADRYKDVFKLAELDERIFGHQRCRDLQWWNDALIRHECLLVTFYGDPVGYILYQHDWERIARVRRFGVRHVHRKRGLAKRMFNSIGGGGVRVIVKERALWHKDCLLAKVFKGLGLRSRLIPHGRGEDSLADHSVLFLGGVANEAR